MGKWKKTAKQPQQKPARSPTPSSPTPRTESPIQTGDPHHPERTKPKRTLRHRFVAFVDRVKAKRLSFEANNAGAYRCLVALVTFLFGIISTTMQSLLAGKFVLILLAGCCLAALFFAFFYYRHTAQVQKIKFFWAPWMLLMMCIACNVGVGIYHQQKIHSLRSSVETYTNQIYSLTHDYDNSEVNRKIKSLTESLTFADAVRSNNADPDQRFNLFFLWGGKLYKQGKFEEAEDVIRLGLQSKSAALTLPVLRKTMMPIFLASRLMQKPGTAESEQDFTNEIIQFVYSLTNKEPSWRRETLMEAREKFDWIIETPKMSTNLFPFFERCKSNILKLANEKPEKS